MDWIEDVGKFHKHIKYFEGDKNKGLSHSRFIKRHAHMLEELVELARAQANNDIVEFADALGDLVYLAIGTARAAGVDLGPVWEEIQRSNMSKTPDSEEMKYCTKGDDYLTPDIEGALADGKL